MTMKAWWEARPATEREAAETLLSEVATSLLLFAVARRVFERWRKSGFALDRKGVNRALICLRYVSAEVTAAALIARARHTRIAAAQGALRGEG